MRGQTRALGGLPPKHTADTPQLQSAPGGGLLATAEQILTLLGGCRIAAGQLRSGILPPAAECGGKPADVYQSSDLQSLLERILGVAEGHNGELTELVRAVSG